MARKGRAKIKASDLHPKLAEGLTLGATAEEAAKELGPLRKVRGIETVTHMREADKRLARGLPYAQFVAEDSADAVWTDGVTDRSQMDYTKTYTKEGMRLLREGRQCLRCDEPHPDPFPLECDLCGYAIKERQVMDISMEFQGDRHLGPRQAITEYMQQLEERTEKRKFIDKVREGGQGRIPKDWLNDPLLK